MYYVINATEKVAFFIATGRKEVATIQDKKAKAVYQIDVETNKIIAKYSSMNEASRKLGKASSRASIRLVCEGLQNTAQGYKWKYADQ